MKFRVLSGSLNDIFLFLYDSFLAGEESYLFVIDGNLVKLDFKTTVFCF